MFNLCHFLYKFIGAFSELSITSRLSDPQGSSGVKRPRVFLRSKNMGGKTCKVLEPLNRCYALYQDEILVQRCRRQKFRVASPPKIRCCRSFYFLIRNHKFSDFFRCSIDSLEHVLNVSSCEIFSTPNIAISKRTLFNAFPLSVK